MVGLEGGKIQILKRKLYESDRRRRRKTELLRKEYEMQNEKRRSCCLSSVSPKLMS